MLHYCRLSLPSSCLLAPSFAGMLALHSHCLSAVRGVKAVHSPFRDRVGLQCAFKSSAMSYVFRVPANEDLVEYLLKVVKSHHLQAAFVQTCVGSVSSATLRLANATPENPNEMIELKQNLEIVSLTGTLTLGDDGNVQKHLHTSLADSKGRVVGGHVMALRTYTTAEVVLGECTELRFRREHDDATGYPELTIMPRS